MTQYNKVLSQLRGDISDIDTEILRLILTRRKISEQIGLLKRDHSKEIIDPDQQKKMLTDYLKNKVLKDLPRKLVEGYLDFVIQDSILLQKNNRAITSSTGSTNLVHKGFSATLPRLTLDTSPSRCWGEPSEKDSAIIMLFVDHPDHSDASLLLTKRTTSVRTHKGEIGFPGGHREKKDKLVSDTALREAFEEIGLDPDQVKVHGSLPKQTSIYGKSVETIVGTTTVVKEKIQNKEVERVLYVPYSKLTRQQSVPFSFNAYGDRRSSHSFLYNEDNIWGLTARVIYSSDMKDPQ